MGQFTGTDGNDVIVGTEGADNITTGKGVDTVSAGGGDDIIYSESTGGTIDGGSGFDVYTGNFGASTAPLTFNIGSTIQVSNGPVVTNVEYVTMGAGKGDDAFNVTQQYGGFLYGGVGSDTLNYNVAGATAGQLFQIATALGVGQFSGGIDSLAFQEFEFLSLTGGNFDDRFEVRGIWDPSKLLIDGGGGNDTALLDLRGGTEATNFVVGADGSASGNRGSFLNVENFALTGNDFADTFVTGMGNDTLGGEAGDDFLSGGGGDDSLIGGPGADTMLGGDGNDRFYGDDPNSQSADTQTGGAGDDEYLQVDALDVIIEGANGGYDSIQALVNYVLPDNVEALTLARFVPWPLSPAISGVGNALDNSITGDDENNVLSGLDGNDTIVGGYGEDTIMGGAGADVLTGGYLPSPDLFSLDGSPDVFKGSASDLNGDRITDFSAGDKIVITDATLAGFTFSLSGDTLTFTGGSLTLQSAPDRSLIAQAAEGGGVQLSFVEHEVRNDINGDRVSDFVLRDQNSGWLTDWIGNQSGRLFSNSANVSVQFPLDWRVVGTADYNGDGRDDTLLRNDAGWLTNWLGTIFGGLTNNGSNTSLFFAPEWKVAGNGDFNGDGKADLLLRRDDGWLTNWLGTATGSFSNNGANTSLFFTTDWKIASTGDFNGDGYTDILLRRDDGWVTNWLGNASGGFTNNGANTALFFTLDWKVVGTGDVNGDGKDDLILRRDDGWITDWLGTSTGSFTNNGANTALFLTTDWKVSSIADFNGDGREDILLRNDSGWMTNWLGTETGSFANNGANFSTFIAPNWLVQDPFM